MQRPPLLELEAPLLSPFLSACFSDCSFPRVSSSSLSSMPVFGLIFWIAIVPRSCRLTLTNMFPYSRILRFNMLSSIPSSSSKKQILIRAHTGCRRIYHLYIIFSRCHQDQRVRRELDFHHTPTCCSDAVSEGTDHHQLLPTQPRRSIGHGLCSCICKLK